jgi:hypothetical protein
MRGKGRTGPVVGALWIGVGMVATASAARAQPDPNGTGGAWLTPPTMLVPSRHLTVPWIQPGEPTGTSSLSPWLASTPLRLSLQAGIQPLARGFANCETREEAAGNTVNGFAVQRFASLRITPALVLAGFSSAGCPVDGAIGGGLTYSVPLEPSLWLTASAGVYGVPAHAPIPARVQSDVRMDLTKALPSGRTLSVGVGKQGLTIGTAAW